jgi:general nucleoside transport system permease protein
VTDIPEPPPLAGALAPTQPEEPEQSRKLPRGLRWVPGAIGPVITTLIAFLMGGVVVLVTGKNPFKVYHAVFNGTGLNWFFHVGSHTARIPFSTHKMWFPFDTASIAAQNLQQTLLLTTPIILTGLAVAFAFRCGMFNIGGQGQYIAGTIFAVWLGSSFSSLNPFLHVTLCLIVGALAGAVYAGIAGILKATVGAHEVISTIMLNWISVWVGSYLFGQGGPLQNSLQPSIPISNEIV